MYRNLYEHEIQPRNAVDRFYEDVVGPDLKQLQAIIDLRNQTIEALHELSPKRDGDLFIARVASNLCTHFLISEELEVLTKKKQYGLQDWEKIEIRDLLQPKWLRVNVSVTDELLPFLSEYLVADDAHSIIQTYSLETLTHISVFDVLKAVYGQRKARVDKNKLSGQDFEFAMKKESLTQEDAFLLAAVLCMTNEKNLPDAKGKVDETVPFYNTLLLFAAVDEYWSTLQSQLPRMSTTSLNPVGRKDRARHAMYVFSGMNALASYMADAIGNDDSVFHPVAKRLIDAIDANAAGLGTTQFMAYITILDADPRNDFYSNDLLRELYALGGLSEDENWYTKLADGVIDLVRRQFPHRVFLIDELLYGVTAIESSDQTKKKTRDEIDHDIDTYTQTLRECRVGATEIAAFSFALEGDALQKLNTRDDVQKLSIVCAGVAAEGYENIAVMVYTKNGTELTLTQHTCALVRDEYGWYVWAEAVDYEDKLDDNTSDLIVRMVRDALEIEYHRIQQVQTIEVIEESPSSFFIIPPEERHAPGRYRVKAGKLDKAQALSNGQMERPMYRVELADPNAVMSTWKDTEPFLEAIALYNENGGGTFKRLTHIKRMTGDIVCELRVGKFRLMYVVKGQEATLIDIVQRKELDRWIESYIESTKYR